MPAGTAHGGNLCTLRDGRRQPLYIALLRRGCDRHTSSPLTRNSTTPTSSVAIHLPVTYASGVLFSGACLAVPVGRSRRHRSVAGQPAGGLSAAVGRRSSVAGPSAGGHVILVCDSGCGQADGWRQLAGFVAAAVSVCMQDRWRISWSGGGAVAGACRGAKPVPGWCLAVGRRRQCR